MGLLGKSFTSKFRSITTLAISRIAILMNQHKARASHARSDVAQFLNLGYQDRALLRVKLQPFSSIYRNNLSQTCYIFFSLSQANIEYILCLLTGGAMDSRAKHVGCIWHDSKLLPLPQRKS